MYTTAVDDVRPHDLLRVRTDALLMPAHGLCLPDWAAAELGDSTSTWFVVRRDDRAGRGLVPVGLRGRSRGRRWATVVDASDIVERLRPADLSRRPADPRRSCLPAFVALAAVASVLDMSHPDQWGPGGSVGYELATGRHVVRTTSDVDLVVDAPRRWSSEHSRRLLDDLCAASAPTHVDVQVQTPCGAFALSEWVRGHGLEPVALKTGSGPRLVKDPWAATSGSVGA